MTTSLIIQFFLIDCLWSLFWGHVAWTSWKEKTFALPRFVISFDLAFYVMMLIKTFSAEYNHFLLPFAFNYFLCSAFQISNFRIAFREKGEPVHLIGGIILGTTASFLLIDPLELKLFSAPSIVDTTVTSYLFLSLCLFLIVLQKKSLVGQTLWMPILKLFICILHLGMLWSGNLRGSFELIHYLGIGLMLILDLVYLRYVISTRNKEGSLRSLLGE